MSISVGGACDVRMVDVTTIQVGQRFRQDAGDLDLLAESIRNLGLLQPIGLTPDMQLIFGGRRLAAMQHKLGWTEVPARILTLDRIIQGEYDENELRKDFTPSERVAIGKELEAQLGERRGRAGGGNPAALKGLETGDLAAKAAGFGNRETYRQAKQVTAQGIPAVVQAMDSGELSIPRAAQIARQPAEEQAGLIGRSAAPTTPTPDGTGPKTAAVRLIKNGSGFKCRLSAEAWADQLARLLKRPEQLEEKLRAGVLLIIEQ